VIAGEEGEDLGGFAVLSFAEAEAAVGDEGHDRYYRRKIHRGGAETQRRKS
jgi:hypothetical protein